jgi:hypothetical protein
MIVAKPRYDYNEWGSGFLCYYEEYPPDKYGGYRVECPTKGCTTSVMRKSKLEALVNQLLARTDAGRVSKSRIVRLPLP